MLHTFIHILLGLSLGLAISGSIAHAKPIEPGEIVRVKLKRLRPTQFNIGLKQVEKKRGIIEKFAKKDREQYLERHPIPVVVGPNGDFYMIDHHHLARAVMDAGYDHAYIQVIEDWSAESRETFWTRMKEQGFVYLHDVNSDKHSVEDLADNVGALTDDPYRALAGEVRDEGGYRKTRTPFSEFKWADYFRAHITPEHLEEKWQVSVRRAIRMARSPNAQLLPGYRGLQCLNLFQ